MKENERKLARIKVLFILAVSMVLLYATGASAADSTVKIYIGDSTAARHHLTLAIDAVSDAFHFEVKGYEVKSSEYVSGSPSVFRIVDASKGTCKVKAVAEGTGMLTLTVQTTDGHTLKETVFVSVFQRVESCQGNTKGNNASVYRGAATNTGVESEDKKGELQARMAVRLVGSCRDFYYVELGEEADWIEGSRYNFMKKSDIAIPVTGIVLDRKEMILSIGKTVSLKASVKPTIADQQNVTWKSSQPLIASVDAKGKVTALREGNTVITVTTAEGGFTSSCQVHVTYSGTETWNVAKKKPTTIKSSGMKLNAVGVSTSQIKVSWKKKTKVKYYALYRATKKNGKYKRIKKLSRKKKSYTDRKLKAGKKYYYRLLVVKKNKKKYYSKKANATTRKAYRAKENLEYFRKQYQYICYDAKQDIDQYSINGYYPAVKYRFDGKCLQIHLYLDFVRYQNSGRKGDDQKYIYNRYDADRTLKLEGETYVNLFLKGLKRTYDKVYIEGSANDLAGAVFETKLVVHDRKAKQYHSGQNFIEVMIGGECPNCELGTNGTYWFHELGRLKNSSSVERLYDGPIIYMPTRKELKKSVKDVFMQEMDKDDYIETAGHEMGHALGLLDAYAAQDRFTKKWIDRCNENMETCTKFKKVYDNIMIENHKQKSIIPNDLEMMLEAYQVSQGEPWYGMQSYKTHSYEGNQYYISGCIKNVEDKFKGRRK